MAFLGHSMAESGKVLEREFPGKWDDNGPLCSSNYSNLMTHVLPASETSNLCETPLPAKRIIIFGFEDSSRVIGLSYIFSTAIDPDTLINWAANMLGVKLNAVDNFHHANLSRWLGVTGSSKWQYQSADQRYLVMVKASLVAGQTDVIVYDIQAADLEAAALDTCLKDFGR